MHCPLLTIHVTFKVGLRREWSPLLFIAMRSGGNSSVVARLVHKVGSRSKSRKLWVHWPNRPSSQLLSLAVVYVRKISEK